MEKTSIEDTLQTLQAILDATEDTAVIENCAKLKGQVEALGAYEESLETRVSEQSKKIKSLIMNDTLPSKGNSAETGTIAPRSITFEEAIANYKKGK